MFVLDPPAPMVDNDLLEMKHDLKLHRCVYRLLCVESWCASLSSVNLYPKRQSAALHRCYQIHYHLSRNQEWIETASNGIRLTMIVDSENLNKIIKLRNICLLIHWKLLKTHTLFVGTLFMRSVPAFLTRLRTPLPNGFLEGKRALDRILPLISLPNNCG